jgi:hypothetical protein
MRERQARSAQLAELTAVAWSAGSTIPFSEWGTVFPEPAWPPRSSTGPDPTPAFDASGPVYLAAPYSDG